jgi:hypothetical protein
MTIIPSLNTIGRSPTEQRPLSFMPGTARFDAIRELERPMRHVSLEEEQRLLQAARAEDIRLSQAPAARLLVEHELRAAGELPAPERAKVRANAMARARRRMKRLQHIAPPRLECLLRLLLDGVGAYDAHLLQWSGIGVESGKATIAHPRDRNCRVYPLSEETVALLAKLPRQDAHVSLLGFTKLGRVRFKRQWDAMCRKAGLLGLRVSDVSFEGNFRKCLMQLA